MQEQKQIRVRALVALYHGEKYYRPGDVLVVPESHFHTHIMEPVDEATPEKITSSGEALDQERRDTLASRTQAGQAAAAEPDPTGAADVLAGNGAKAAKK